MRRELAILCQEVTDLTLQLEVSDATHAMEADFLYEEIDKLHHQLEEARDPGRIEEPLTN